MKNNVTILIIGMMLVTFIPRLIPFLLMDKINIPKKAKVFLGYIPYAALGALIFPDGFNAVPSMPTASTIGIIVAFVFSYFSKNIILVVFASIISTYIVILLGN